MTNYRKFEKEIRDADYRFAVVDGNVLKCKDTKCELCKFIHATCASDKIEWLYEEYAPELTKGRIVYLMKHYGVNDMGYVLECKLMPCQKCIFYGIDCDNEKWRKLEAFFATKSK